MTNTASNLEPPQAPGRARLKSNMAWLGAERVLRLAVGVVVFGAIGRRLGPDSFGLLNYSSVLVSIFTALATVGMDGIVIRELMLHHDKRDSILGTAAVLRVFGTIVCVGAAWLSSLQTANQGNVPLLTFIIALGLFPMAMEVIDWWFQMRTESRYTVQAKIIASLIGSAIKLTLVKIAAPLYCFAIALALDGALIAGSLVWTFNRRGLSVRSWRFDSKVAKTILHDAWPLILSGLLVALYMRVEQLVVMNWLGKSSAGLYSAAGKFTDIWGILPTIVATTFYPRLVDWRARDAEGYAQRMQFMFDALAALGILIALGTVLLAPLVIRIIFGPKYAGADQILMVLGLAAPFSFLGTARAQYMLLERVTIHHTPAAIIGIAVNFSIAWYAVPRIGAVGAALGSCVGFFVSAYVTSWIIPALRPCARLQTRALLTPWIRLIKANKHA